MRKYYKFIFIVLFGLFIFLPKDTFAATAESIDISDVYLQNSSNYELQQKTSLRYNGFNFVGAYSNLGINMSRFYFTNSLETNKYYDFYFTIHRANTGHLGNPPVVKLNNTLCETYANGSRFYPVYKSNIEGYRYQTSGSGALPIYPIIDGVMTDGNEILTPEIASNSPIYFVKCSNISNVTDNNLSVYSAGRADTDLFYGLSDVMHYDVSIYQEFIEQQEDVTNAQKETTDAVKEQTEATKEQTDTIKDKDTSESQSEASGFFDDFESDDFGLSDIITMPLTFIQGLSSSTCYSLNLPLPFVDTNVTLPCMTSIYQRYFGSFLTLYQTITTGIIAYWCCINIFRMVQGFKNPDSDEIEVMDL